MILPALTEAKNSLLQWESSQPSEGDDAEIEEDLKEKEKRRPNHEDENDDIGGKIMLSHALFLNDNDLLSETISGDEHALAENIDFCFDDLPDDCPLLNVITNAAYIKLFTAVATKIMQQFSDVPLMEEYCPSSEEYYRPTCAGCKWEEDANDRFLMCGGCKAVYYCSKDCQKRHWRTGHKIKCKRVVNKGNWYKDN